MGSRRQALTPTQSYLCKLVETLHVTLQALHVLLTCKAPVTIHDERHMFWHGSSLAGIMQIRGWVETPGHFNGQYRFELLVDLQKSNTSNKSSLTPQIWL